MFENIIGQWELKKKAERAIVAAKYRGDVLGHVLIRGLGGLGKTFILESVCRELNYEMFRTQGNRLNSPKKIRNFLTQPKNYSRPSFFMIDEIQEIPLDYQEELYYPMEKFVILTQGDPLSLTPFCLAAATTAPEKLDGKSLINRFAHSWRVEELSTDDLLYIISNYLRKEQVYADFVPMNLIAQRSRGIPRLALHYAAHARDIVQARRKNRLTEQDVEKMFLEEGIDEQGLDKIQQQYLLHLYKVGKPMSKDSLAASLDEISSDQLTRVIEPYLWKLGFICSSSKGRTLTETGNLYVAKTYAFTGEI